MDPRLERIRAAVTTGGRPIHEAIGCVALWPCASCGRRRLVSAVQLAAQSSALTVIDPETVLSHRGCSGGGGSSPSTSSSGSGNSGKTTTSMM